MDSISNRLPFRQTGAFSKIALDYIDQVPALKPFFAHPVSVAGIQKVIEERRKNPVDREILVRELKTQYEGIQTSDKVNANIESLSSPDTFTVTTAHQNNIFTGPLYFIYKIVHAIKLADNLTASLPSYNFVPVYYMGSEDADLEELNHIQIGEEKLVWATEQKGAVGRMRIDKELVKLITAIEGQLSVLPYGNEIANKLKEYYKEGTTVQDATFHFVDHLFAEYGLIVLLPDNAALKRQLKTVFEDDLLHQAASAIVEKTAAELHAAGYKVQANPREINLFYLKDDQRERIELVNGEWKVVNETIRFTKDELLKELDGHPERFSPNVILRGLYQEAILPNVAFIGGGGETAYWLQLKELFAHYKIIFPVLVLRNSFLIVEEKWKEKISKLGFAIEDMFLPAEELLNRLVVKESKNEIKLNGSLLALEQLYDSFKKQATAIDTTLEKHVDALRSRSVYRLQELEKKMLRAEKKKFEAQQRQIQAIKAHLFPGNGLQERYENLSYYFALWGKQFIRQLYDCSLGLEQEFVIMEPGE